MVKIRHITAWMKSDPLGPGRVDNQPMFMDDDIVDSINLNADTDEIEIRGRKSFDNQQFIFRASVYQRMGTLTIVKGAKRDVQVCDDATDKIQEPIKVPDKTEEVKNDNPEKQE